MKGREPQIHRHRSGKPVCRMLEAILQRPLLQRHPRGVRGCLSNRQDGGGHSTRMTPEISLRRFDRIHAKGQIQAFAYLGIRSRGQNRGSFCDWNIERANKLQAIREFTARAKALRVCPEPKLDRALNYVGIIPDRRGEALCGINGDPTATGEKSTQTPRIGRET